MSEDKKRHMQGDFLDGTRKEKVYGLWFMPTFCNRSFELYKGPFYHG